MAITTLEESALLSELRRSLHLPTQLGAEVDVPLIASLLRRAAGILCPCSPATLSSAVFQSLQHLVANAAQLEEQVEETLERLVSAGDLLELNQVTSDDPGMRGTWLFAAPPSFVDRKNGSFYLLGTSRDEQLPLPTSLRSRVDIDRHFRILRQEGDEQPLTQTLRELGFTELSERTWLRSPKDETARATLDAFNARLMNLGPSGDVEEMQIIDPDKSVTYYRGRWIAPKDQTGYFVARRPHAYGAHTWGYVSLDNGRATRFLDFPFGAYNRWRGCDVAWQLQLAIDSCRGTPQKYRRREIEHGAVLDFFSPLPLWAERSLAISGVPTDRDKSLLSYFIPTEKLAAEEQFLLERLWLTRTNQT